MIVSISTIFEIETFISSVDVPISIKVETRQNDGLAHGTLDEWC
jgi:hypothetical protein